MTRPVAALLAALMLLSLCACDVEEPQPDGVRIYYLKHTAEGSDWLGYEHVVIPEEASREDRCTLVLEAMGSPRQEGHVSALPSGLAVAVTFQGSVATIVFDSAFDDLPDGRKSLIVTALAMSLLELRDINFMYVSAGGKRQPPFYDRPISRSSFITQEDAQRYFGG